MDALILAGGLGMRPRRMADAGWNILATSHPLRQFALLLDEAWSGKHSLDVVFFVSPERLVAFKQAFADRPTLDFKIAAPGAQVIFAES